jgi:hypothetical protein
MTALTSLVVVDVSQVYTPLFSIITGPLTIATTAMLVPRVGTASQYVEYDLAGIAAGSSPNVCTGYL